MPPFTIGGRSFLVSADDFTLAVLPSVGLHLVWIAVDTSRTVQSRCKELGVDPALLILDACLCLAITLVDLIIAVLSAQGRIMAERRHPHLFKCMLWPRLLLSLPLFAIYMVVVVYILLDVLHEYFHFKDLLGEATLPHWSWLPGWGPEIPGFWADLVAELLIFLRLVIMVPGAFFLSAVVIPKQLHSELALGGITRALKFAGVQDGMLEGIVKILLDVMGQGTLDVATPTDLAFGLLLVAARQRQGPLGRRPWRGAGLPASTERASVLPGVTAPPVPLDPASEKDREALRMITHFVAYATGIYGVSVDIASKSVYYMSSVPSPLRFMRAVREALFWKPPPTVRQAEVTGDLWWHLNEKALRRVAAAQAKLEGTPEPDLLWATWKSRGLGTSPPLAVLFDKAYKKLVIVIRGTMDAKDCVSDIGAGPAFFDPLGLAGPGDAKEAPFDESTGLYAHSTMIACAQDALNVLKESRILDRSLASDGVASGCGLVCTGHSLGAGVACLLALMLRAERSIETTDVRYIGFEPPGGLLSKRLSELTGQLGFLAAVCANDWISRLSIRAVQDIRERLLDELEQCDRSKLQLTWLVLGRGLQAYLPMLPCRPFVRLCEWLGGGALDFEEPPCSGLSHTGFARRGFSSLRSRVSVCQPAGSGLFTELWPPSRIVYFRPIAVTMWVCSMYEVATRWTAEWAQPEDLHELILAARSVELHFPNIIKSAFRSVAVDFDAVDYSDCGSSVASDFDETSSSLSGSTV
mmetsp:Transcript_105679/g.309084  ORF Transcript_105679/g.309084 Transcript_105679/m.309084 type:complete len:753 (-) Transcript_105679:123-2381(-)